MLLFSQMASYAYKSTSSQKEINLTWFSTGSTQSACSANCFIARTLLYGDVITSSSADGKTVVTNLIRHTIIITVFITILELELEIIHKKEIYYKTIDGKKLEKLIHCVSKKSSPFCFSQ